MSDETEIKAFNKKVRKALKDHLDNENILSFSVEVHKVAQVAIFRATYRDGRVDAFGIYGETAQRFMSRITGIESRGEAIRYLGAADIKQETIGFLLGVSQSLVSNVIRKGNKLN